MSERTAHRQWVFHVDMDQFLAAVELLRHPELVGRPVVVGGRGDPTERAVVSTASYEARAFGIRSGMALRLAVRRCPEAVFLPVDHPVYEDASRAVMAALRTFRPGIVVEELGWDEAFVGVPGLDVEHTDPEPIANTIRSQVLQATGLHCSVGIGDTLVRAKTATSFGKPQGSFRLDQDNWLPVMGERPVTALWGVGKRIGARLGGLGITMVRELAAADESILLAEFGQVGGTHLSQLGCGGGCAWPDGTPRIARAHGHETTYQVDLNTPEQGREALQELAIAVINDLRAEGRPAIRVFLKVRFVPFFTFNRSRKLASPTFAPEVLTDTAFTLYQSLDDARPVRLLGIRAEMTGTA